MAWMTKVQLFDQVLWADLDAPRKQRHTVRRIFDRLVAEHVVFRMSYSGNRSHYGLEAFYCRPGLIGELGHRQGPPADLAGHRGRDGPPTCYSRS